ncbi:MAG: hypothetical protein ACHQ0J_01700 [Candidatus Dormibacterales bacterium]
MEFMYSASGNYLVGGKFSRPYFVPAKWTGAGTCPLTTWPGGGGGVDPCPILSGYLHGVAPGSICTVTAFTEFGTTDIKFYSGTTVSHAYFEAYWGVCTNSVGTNYIQFASETSYTPSQITTPTEIQADLWLYNCNVIPCTTVFEGASYEGTGTYQALYEDSNIYLSNSSEWCMYFSYQTSYSFIYALNYNPHTVASGSVENCVSFG